MSKLEKVIKQLENISFPFENSDWSIIEDCTESLIELNKPAQYTVEIKRKEGEPGIFFYEATCNNKRPIGRSNTVELIKEYVFAQLNIMAEILSMPTIVIDQIKFLEL